MSTVFAVDVAYIVKAEHAADLNHLKMFQEKNMSYEVIADADINRAKLSDYSIIVIGDDKLRNVKKIPIDSRVVIMNRYHADYFGFIDGNALQVSANGNLQMNKKNKKIDVYTQPFYNLKKVGLPIYYLLSEHMNNETESVTTIVAGSRSKEGSVIAYKEDKCFFGIPASEFWSEDVKELFEDCMMFVMQSGKHDVKIDDSLANSVNGIRIKNEFDQYLTEPVAQLSCNQRYKIDFKTVNTGSFTEDINFTGKIDSFSWTAEKEDLQRGDSTTTGSKTISINTAGEYDLTIAAVIKNDNNPSDNTKTRKVKVVC